MAARRVRWLVVGLLALDVGFLVMQLALQQLRVVAVAPPEPALWFDDGRWRRLATAPLPSMLSVEVENASLAGGPARIDVPALRSAKRATLFDVASYRTRGDFAVAGDLRDRGVWRSETSGAVLEWSGFVSGLTVALHCAPGFGRACVQATGVARQCHDLSACGGWVDVRVPSLRAAHHTLMPWWRGSFRITSASPAVLEELTVWLGDQQLYRQAGVSLDRRMAVEIPLGVRMRAVAGLAANAAGLLGQCLAVIAVMAFVGAAVVLPLAGRVGPFELVLLAVFAGEGLTANAVTALGYVLPAARAWPIVLGVAAVASLAQLWRCGLGAVRRSLGSATADERRALPWLVAIACASSLAVAFPAVVFPGWFLGQGYTDSIDYPGWASLAITAPISRDLGAIRFEDFVRVSITALTLGTDTRSAMVVQALRLWWLLPFVAWAFLARFGARPAARLAGAIVAAHALCLFEIFTQCYLPHYEVTQFGIVATWAVAWFADEHRRGLVGRERWWAEATLACVFATAVGLYPYQAFPVIAWGVVTVAIVVWRRSGAELWSLVRVVGLTVLVCNVNLEVVFDFSGSSMQHRKALNDIGRYVVFPWHAQPVAVAILAGTDDFVRHSALKARFLGELFGGMPHTGARFARVEAALAALVPVATAVVVPLAVASLGWLARRRDRAAAAAVLGILMPGVLAVMLYRSDDVYFWVKSVMTLAGLAVVPFAGIVGVLVASERRLLWMPAALVAVLWVVLGLRTSFFDTVAYALNRESVVLDDARTAIGVNGRALREFHRWAEALPAGRRFVLVGTLYDRYWTDIDIITYNRILQSLEPHTVRHAGGESMRYTRSRDPAYRGPEPLGAFDYVIEFNGCGEVPAPSTVVMTTDLFCVRAITHG